MALPPQKRPGLQDNVSNYAEGRLNQYNYEDPPPSSPPLPFVKMVVMDVVFDPNNDLLDSAKLAYWEALGIVNTEWINVLPRNTIIAKKVAEESSPIFVFPFFPSHLALPCKPGEFVWAFFEDGTNLSASRLRAYWMCKVTEPHTVDDVNHTHAPRDFEPTLFPNAKDNYEENNKTIHELRNGPVNKKERTTSFEQVVLPNEQEDIFEQLVTKTQASNLISYESIPRYRKRPGDIALEGTNNTLIVLGTDRANRIADYQEPTDPEDLIKQTLSATYPGEDFKSEAGSIDLVVGRGQTQETSGTSASTTSIIKNSEDSVGQEIKRELDKTITEISPREGDPDWINDRSRIVLSQRTKVDTNLGIDEHNRQFLGEDGSPIMEDSENGDSAIVIKSDKVRIIARSDVQMLVTNYNEAQSTAGTTIKKDSDSLDQWASITIKSNGDIVFKPSQKGYIRLGADDADRAILCTDKPAIMREGLVSYKPGLISTGAHVVGTGSPGQGTFSKKVLVR